MHVGILDKDSPGLAQNLKRYLKEGEADRVRLAYHIASRHGALQETGVVRQPEASYNPRPARVAQILMTELRSFDAEILCCAILGCAKIEEAFNLPEELSTLQEPVNELREVLSINNLEASTSMVEGSLYAIILDEVRHLHMTDFSIDYLREKMKFIQNLIENKESYKENQRLVEKIQSSITKLEKFIQSNG